MSYRVANCVVLLAKVFFTREAREWAEAVLPAARAVDALLEREGAFEGAEERLRPTPAALAESLPKREFTAEEELWDVLRRARAGKGYVLADVPQLVPFLPGKTVWNAAQRLIKKGKLVPAGRTLRRSGRVHVVWEVRK